MSFKQHFICAKFFFPQYCKHLAKFLQHPEKKNQTMHTLYLLFSLYLFFVASKPDWKLSTEAIFCGGKMFFWCNNKSTVWFLWDFTTVHQKTDKKIHNLFRKKRYQTFFLYNYFLLFLPCKKSELLPKQF